MSRLIPNLTLLLSLTLLMAAVGCEDPNAGLGDQDQAALNAADRIAELEEHLNQADRDLAAERERNLALQNQINQLNDKLAQGGAADGWTTIPGGAMISIEGTVLFDSGKAALKSGARGTLGGVAQTIVDRYPGHDIYVFGHTDNEPIQVSGWKDNYELSCQRALSVLRHLRSAGVSQDIAACGWGEDRPATDNRNASAKQVNRRVEIFAMARKNRAVADAATTGP